MEAAAGAQPKPSRRPLAYVCRPPGHAHSVPRWVVPEAISDEWGGNEVASNEASSPLAVRRLTLYKHGVGVVEREGIIDGEEVALTLRAAEVDDVLKSLLISDRRGGQTLGIRYDTPTDRETRLRESPMKLSPDYSLLDLLRSLRGLRVRLVMGEGTQAGEVSGRLLGLDLPPASDVRDAVKSRYDEPIVSLLDDAQGATVTSLPLSRVRRVMILDERAAQDLTFFLDMSRANDAQRTIMVGLSPGEHDLAISYLVPSPTWRVSYRLVAESKAPDMPALDTPGGETTATTATTAATGADAGELLLQGWGLFDNPLEEDLADVEVTLVAGQPISFVYDLTTSRVPARPVVRDAARVAAGPVEFEGAAPAPAMAFALRDEEPGTFMAEYDAAPGAAAPRAMAARARKVASASIETMATQTAAATGSELGELFQYDVTAPVTVRRGGSVMAPILSARLPYRRELLFNERKLPGHPVAAIRFDNRSGLVLERGPVTVHEDGAYHGEAMVPFAKDGDAVYLAFAVELGVRVTTATDRTVETVGLSIADAYLNLRQATLLRLTYRVENTSATAREVTLEHPITARAELNAAVTRGPDARTAEFYRWTVACPGRATVTFLVEERLYNWQTHRLLDYSYDALQEYLSRKWLDAATMAQLTRLFEEQAAIARNEREVADLVAERDEVYKREEQLRRNMAALGTSGDEGALRARIVAQLQASEDRLDAIDARSAALKEENVWRQHTIDAELGGLRVASDQ